MKKVVLLNILLIISFNIYCQLDKVTKYSLSLVSKASYFLHDSSVLDDYILNLDFKVNNKSDSLINLRLSKFYKYSIAKNYFGRKSFWQVPEVTFPFYCIGCNKESIAPFFKNIAVNLEKYRDIELKEKILKITNSTFTLPEIKYVYWNTCNDILILILKTWNVISLSHTDSYPPTFEFEARQLLVNLKENKIVGYKELFSDSALVFENTQQLIKNFKWVAGDSTSELDTVYTLAEGQFNSNKNFIIDKLNKIIGFNLIFIHEDFYDNLRMEIHIEPRYLPLNYEELGINKQTVKKMYHPFFFEN